MIIIRFYLQDTNFPNSPHVGKTISKNMFRVINLYVSFLHLNNI
jgi:hypothetical protein